jgi:hypothetical protein
LGNRGDDRTLPEDVVQLENFPTNLNFWIKVIVTIDSTNKKIDFDIVDTRTGNILENRKGLNFAADINYAKRVAALRLLASRPDGSYPVSGWITYLDNIAFYSEQEE